MIKLTKSDFEQAFSILIDRWSPYFWERSAEDIFKNFDSVVEDTLKELFRNHFVFDVNPDFQLLFMVSCLHKICEWGKWKNETGLYKDFQDALSNEVERVLEYYEHHERAEKNPETDPDGKYESLTVDYAGRAYNDDSALDFYLSLRENGIWNWNKFDYWMLDERMGKASRVDFSLDSDKEFQRSRDKMFTPTRGTA